MIAANVRRRLVCAGSLLGMLLNSVGCVPTPLHLPEAPSVPVSFGLGTTGPSTASLPWTNFFSDPVLLELIKEALESNPDLGIAIQRLAKARAAHAAAVGARLPILNAIAAITRTRFGRYTMDGAGNRGTQIIGDKTVPGNLPDYVAGFEASWEIDLWGRLSSLSDAARERLLASHEGIKLVETGLVADVASAFFEGCAARDRLRLLNDFIALQTEALEVAKAQREVGGVNELAVQQFVAQLLKAKALRADNEQEIVEAQSRLNILLARFPGPADEQSCTLPTPAALHIVTGLPSEMIERRPDIRFAAAELRATSADVEAARAAFFPAMTLFGEVGVQAFRPNLLGDIPQSFAYSIGGSIFAPLLNRAALEAEFAGAEAGLIEAHLSYRKTVVEAFYEVSNEITRLKNLESARELRSSEAAALARAVEVAQELFRMARGGYLDVIVARQSELESRLELLDLRKRELDASVALYRALGGGWQERDEVGNKVEKNEYGGTQS